MLTRASISIVLVIGLATVGFAKVLFHEEFNGDWQGRWKQSTYKGEQQGTFERSKGKWKLSGEKPFGLRTTLDAKFYDISTHLPTPISTKDTPFVLQYSLKQEQEIECGGGYIKLLGTNFKTKEFGGDTPLLIMFGPDMCGGDNKIQLIFDFDGKQKQWVKTPPAPTDTLTHVYTLLLNPNETYEVFLDKESIAQGTVGEDWAAAPPKLIPDLNDKKPADWDDRMYLDDPKSTKPADWIEQEYIEDSSAVKPEDWDEAKEGEWKATMVKNPGYNGKWKPNKIYNINYKGVWAPKKIPNPNYTDKVMKPYVIGGVGIDVWQVRHGSIFDNIMMADSLDDAFVEAKKILEGQVVEEATFAAEEQKEEEKAKAKENEQDEDEDEEAEKADL